LLNALDALLRSKCLKRRAMVMVVVPGKTAPVQGGWSGSLQLKKSHFFIHLTVGMTQNAKGDLLI